MVALTQPLVVHPVTNNVSTFSFTNQVMSGVWKNIDGAFLQYVKSEGSWILGSISVHS